MMVLKNVKKKLNLWLILFVSNCFLQKCVDNTSVGTFGFVYMAPNCWGQSSLKIYIHVIHHLTITNNIEV